MRKYGKYSLEDYLKIAETLGVGKSKSKIIIKKTIEFEKEHTPRINDTRMSEKLFSKSMQSIYDKRVIQLKKQGILQELGLIEKYGGVLKSEKKKKS